eukprot:2346637-Pleurochrysis_carterae.AAC.1
MYQVPRTDAKIIESAWRCCQKRAVLRDGNDASSRHEAVPPRCFVPPSMFVPLSMEHWVGELGLCSTVAVRRAAISILDD